MGQMRVRRTGPWVKISCPFSWVQFIPRVGHGVGQAVGPHFGPYLKVHFCNEKHPKSEDFRCFLELLGRFELPTSSLPILPRLFFPTLLCFVLKPETLAAQGFQAFLFCIFIFPVLRSRMGFLMPVWVLYGFCSVQSAAIF